MDLVKTNVVQQEDGSRVFRFQLSQGPKSSASCFSTPRSELNFGAGPWLCRLLHLLPLLKPCNNGRKQRDPHQRREGGERGQLRPQRRSHQRR